MQRINKCVFAVSLCALFCGSLAHAQSGGVTIIDGSAAQSLKELEPRTILMPPGQGEMLPVSATAVITISSPGSYVLGGNVVGVAGKHGIEIKKSNVTLDLNGFALIGTTDSLSGIDVPSSAVNVKIHNGAIRGWGQRGINGKKLSASEVSDVRVGNCKWHGIFLGDGIVSGCTSRLNGGDGINVANGKSVVESCAVERNGGNGVVVNGVDSDAYTTICKVSSTGNAGSGIVSQLGCTITECSVGDNGGWGILAYRTSVVERCAAERNTLGGIEISNGSIVRNCAVRGHDGTDVPGIRMVNGDSMAIGNMLDGNDIGIECLSSDCRIDGNNVTDGTTGIKVTSSGSFIVRNSVASPTDYDIAIGNSVGTIIDTSSPGVEIITTNPWANFEY